MSAFRARQAVAPEPPIGAQNAFAADFHSWRRCAMS
jgi:hypothetical protein